MQKWKVCKKLMAVILTLCMVLPLISNQYLVVRAEETGTGTTDTKKLSDLIAADDYVPVDLTKGEDVTLTDQTWTTDSYEYVTSYYQESDNAQKQTNTDRGTLYQIQKSEEQLFKIEMDLNNQVYWYEEDSIDEGYSQGDSEDYYTRSEKVYLWIPKTSLYESEVPDTYTITFMLGKQISEYKDRAATIALNQTIDFDKNADNYIKNVSPDNHSISDGWLYKSSFELGYYTLNLDNNGGYFQIEVFPLNQEGQYQFTSEMYTDETNSQEEQLLLENGYIFIRNVANAENVSISLDAAKKLSELTIPELVKGESYTSTSEDSSWKAGAYGYQHRIYKISVAAGKMASVFVKKMNDSSARRIEVLDENRMELEEKDFSISGSTTNVEQHLILNNDTNTEKVYYVGVYAMDGTETYTISYEDIATIDAYAEKAVSLTEETPITFAENDARLIKYVSYEYDYTPACPCYTEGALVTFDVPAKTSATFKLANDSSNTNYFVYTDLADEESRQTVGTASYAVYNDTDTVKKYYVLIPVNQAVNATVSVKMKKSIQLREVPELQVGDNTVTTDAQTVEYTYAGTTEYWNGHVYQFTVPDEGTYAIGLKYTGTDLDTFKSMKLDMYSSDENGGYAGYINNVSTNNYDKMDVLSSYLENGETYYFKLQYTVDNQAITEAKDMQGVTIFIEKDVPEIKDILDSAQTITAATEDAVSGDDMRIVKIDRSVFCGKLYQITIPADYEAAIEADKGRVDIYEQVSGAMVDTSDYVRSSNWNENAIKGVLQNNSDEAKTYYVFVKSPFSKVTVGEFKQQTPATPIESADIAELTLKDAKLLSDLKKQNISFSVWDYNTNTVKNTKKESYWLKFTVPENEVYTLDTSYSETYGDGSWTFTVWSYYDKYDAYVSGGNHLVNSGNYTRRMDRFTEGTYYIAIEGSEELLPIQISLNQMAKIDSLKDSAIELPESYTTSVDKILTVQRPYKDADYEVAHKEATGKLYSFKVPAKNKVEITATKNAGLVIYSDLDDAPIADETSSVTFNNLANEEQTYYLWVEGDNDGVVVTTTKTSLESKKETTENGEKVETTVDTTDDDTLIIIAEDKDAAGKVADATVKVEQKGGISEDAIKKSIDVVSQYNSDNDGKEQISNIQASYTDDSQATVSSDVLNSLKDAQVSLEISKKASDGTVEYTWSFDADSLKETEVTGGVNTKLEVFEDAEGYGNQKVVEELTDPDATKCVVAFAHDGELPKNTKVTIAVGDQYADGTTVYYYHINKETNVLEPIDSVVVKDGMVTLVLSHCSDYVICDKKVCKHEKTEVRNAKEASCTEAGYTGDTYCVDCDTKLATGEVIAKKDHTSSDWIVDKAATVDAEGSRHKECTVCKTVLAKEAIAKLPAPTPTPEPVVIPDVTIRYTTHVQTFGWQGDENNASKWFVNGNMAGTSGKAKRLEGIKIRVYGNDNLGIQYTTHCQSYGWLPWSANGEMNGTEGEAKRLEAIKIQLTGADKDKYDVYYRVHAQSYGWLGWAKNGAPSGTAGYAKRLEGIQIVVVKKGAAAPGVNYAGVNAASGVHQAKSYIAKAGSSPVVGNQATSNTNPSVAGEANVNVAYRTHVQTFGWQGWKYNGQMSGTSGQAKRLEGIDIKLTNKPYSGSIVYTTHVQTYGWQGNENNPNTWKRDGDMSGTSGEAKRLEAIRIALTGEMAEHYDVYYRVHAQSFGWLGWAKNGEAAGTAGLAKRLEGIQIVLVPKGGNAPARSYQGVTSVKTQAYIKK